MTKIEIVSVLWVKYNFTQAVQLHLIGSGIAQSGSVCFFQKKNLKNLLSDIVTQ
jgi:hypothetical protein